jgi:hypothetical protein
MTLASALNEQGQCSIQNHKEHIWKVWVLRWTMHFCILYAADGSAPLQLSGLDETAKFH